jgi:hypothetical protein
LSSASSSFLVGNLRRLSLSRKSFGSGFLSIRLPAPTFLFGSLRD